MEENGPSESRQRTLLADDRTFLAWLRTAFGAYAVAIGVGGVLPELAHTDSRALHLLGAAFAVLGIGAVALGTAQYVLFRRTADPGALQRPLVVLTLAYAFVIAVLGVVVTCVIAIGP